MNTIELLKTKEMCGADYTHNNNNYHIGTIEIDPDTAYALLHDNRNRNIKPGNLQKIQSSIARDGWDVGISMIVFTDSGRLIDGQHRLKACIETDTPIISVYSIVPDAPLAMRSIDRGAKRSLADDLRLAGETNTPMLATLIRVAYAYYKGVMPEEYFASEKYKTIVTDADYFQFFQTKVEELRAVTRYVQMFYKALRNNTTNVITPRTLAYLFLTFYNLEPEESVNFFNALSGAKVVGCPEAILNLRQKLGELDRMTARPSVRVVAAYVIKTWNAYITGETLPQITFRGGGAHPEKFPKVVIAD